MAATISDKQYLAKVLFTREGLDQKTVAKRVGTSEKTMSEWVNKFNWRSLRQRLVVGKEEILNDMYQELEELQAFIRNKKSGERFSDTAQADIKVKLTAAIRNMETKLAIADLVESGIRFLRFLQATGNTDQVLEISDLWNSFIQDAIKK